MEDKIKKLEAWVVENYNPTTCSWTDERSAGNSYDCFEDGQENARSWAAYSVGSILGMELEEPECSEDE